MCRVEAGGGSRELQRRSVLTRKRSGRKPRSRKSSTCRLDLAPCLTFLTSSSLPLPINPGIKYVVHRSMLSLQKAGSLASDRNRRPGNLTADIDYAENFDIEEARQDQSEHWSTNQALN